MDSPSDLASQQARLLLACGGQRTTPCLENVPHLVHCNFDIRERILIVFGRNVTDKASNQKMLYYVTSNKLCFGAILAKRRNMKIAFSLKLPKFNQSLPDFFNLFDS